jgi:hypothetical protein
MIVFSKIKHFEGIHLCYEMYWLLHKPKIVSHNLYCRKSKSKIFLPSNAIFRDFMLGWQCILNYMNSSQHGAPFISNLLSYHTSTCFGRIGSPSSGGRMYILVCGKWYLLYKGPEPVLTLWGTYKYVILLNFHASILGESRLLWGDFF